jgi:hypothetical protein
MQRRRRPRPPPRVDLPFGQGAVNTPARGSPRWPTTAPSRCGSDAPDNVGTTLAESFFASLKLECLNQQAWPSQAAARRAIVEYISWFNGSRLHSTLGYLTPNEFEATTQKQTPAKVA